MSDGSGRYAAKSNLYLYIAQSDAKVHAAFKAFLTSYSLQWVAETEMEDAKYLKGFPVQAGGHWVYQVDLTIPAANAPESVKIMDNIDVVRTMIQPNLGQGYMGQNPRQSPLVQGPINKYTYQYMLLNNLIHNGTYKGSGTFLGKSAWGNISRYGAFVSITNLGYSPEIDMGFFDASVNLYPKAVKISISAVMLNRKGPSRIGPIGNWENAGAYNNRVYQPLGKIKARDPFEMEDRLRNQEFEWPWGVPFRT